MDLAEALIPGGPGRPLAGDHAAKLARVKAVLASMGNPQTACPAIHVGGTNGKGSVCAMIASILLAAGLSVGRFTSPHLEDWTERMWENGSPIAPETLASVLAECREAQQATPGADELGEFARITVAAFLWFSRSRPDAVVLEVGRGGRYDATNVVPDPMVSIVTQVAGDHLDVLGPTAADIAWHKAGIARPGRPLLTAATGEALDALASAAAELGARVESIEPARYLGALPAGQRIASGGRTWDLGLQGTFQLTNVALALAAIERLRRQGLDIPDAAIGRGLRDVVWPGRMESWSHEGERWLFDGAHNLAGAAELAASLDRDHPGEAVTLVFGVMDDKPGQQMLEQLASRARTVFLTTPPDGKPCDPHELARGLSHSDARVLADPRAALTAARGETTGRLIVVCGSLYLVGLARAVAGAPNILNPNPARA